jgi:prevent-host-death family protein
MTITVNMHEAKTQLSRLVERVCQGEEVIIARDGSPVVRLVPYRQNGDRPAGIFAGKFFVPDDFNDPLPDEFGGTAV